ncbi:MAG: putative zinc-binding metallopeptidase [Thermodesulfobacteriota bacterium]|nr:putative zinc-binding metallopeptidase [Thermodesulfobacteriota bacterium]
MDEISYQKFLTTRICDLGLDVNESMAPYFKRLKRELREKEILLWPDFYFGNEWGCVNKKISISIPFYLAIPELKDLEGDTPTNEEMIKILRHETGHAINYAYKIWQQKEWKETFGDFRKKYPTQYLSRVNPWSKSYVRHLHYLGDPHYAQKHPDEDWAETFAIWLDPRSHWEERYRNWPNALEKLVYMDRQMEEITGKGSLNISKKQDGPYAIIEETVSEWWGLDGEILDRELQEYLNDMNELFVIPLNGRRKLLPAWKLIRKYARVLTERVSLWISGSNKHTVRKCLRQWEAICRNESLGYLPEDEERLLIELTTLLTYHVVDGVHHLRN